MSKGKTNNKNTNKKNVNTTVKKVNDLTCGACGELKKISEYYVSYNPVHQTGKIPYCKTCLKKMISDQNGNVILDKVKSTLQLIDKPFLYNIWRTSLEDEKDTFGTYMKNIQMPQYRKLGWSDSKMLPEVENKLNYNNVEEETKFQSLDNFQITTEILMRWKGNHSIEDYQKLEEFYWDMKNKNKIETPQEEIYLKKLATISVKMDNELAECNYDEVKKLGDLFSKYMADSQFRAIDKTEADKTCGIRTYCQAYAEAEKDDFIPPWEYYRKIKDISQDIVDKTIMHIENHTLRMNKINIMTEPPSDTPKLEEGEF